MLGRELCETLSRHEIAWTGSGREIDITDASAVREYAAAHKPAWIINCAAYTNVDKAESDQEQAMQTNGIGPGVLAVLAAGLEIPLVHFSTDYVFDGSSPVAYKETDQTRPLSVYGKTKLAGELRIVESAKKFYIFRISWLYGLYGKNFVATILRLLKEKQELTIIDDQRGSPTWTKNLAENIVHLITHPGQEFGIYHCADEGVISWHEFAVAIADLALERGLIERAIPIRPIPTEAYPLPAVRPKNSAFDKTNVKRLGFILSPWRDNLARHLDQLVFIESGCILR